MNQGHFFGGAPFFWNKNYMEQMYSLKSAASLLDISVKTLRRLIKDKDIQIYRVRQSIRLKESDIKQLVKPEQSIEDYGLTI